MFNPSEMDTLSPSSLVGEVGFAGVATVFKAINESDNGKLLPGIGTGIRFRAFPETNFQLGEVF
jgi:hypothetical protein